MRVVDANVLLYAVNRDARQHAPARAWLDAALTKAEPVGFAWIVILAFLRVSTRGGIFPRPLDPSDALDQVRRWLAQPTAVLLHPTTRHLDVLASFVHDAGAAGNLVSDAHLAALAVEYGATVVSFDRDLARFTGVQCEVPNG